MEFNATAPIWLQGLTALKRQIVTGELPPGAKMLSGREFAIRYGINPNTAARIYQELEEEGLCRVKRGMGTFVTEDENLIADTKKALAESETRQFLKNMAALGLGREEILEYVQKEMENNA